MIVIILRDEKNRCPYVAIGEAQRPVPEHSFMQCVINPMSYPTALLAYSRWGDLQEPANRHVLIPAPVPADEFQQVAAFNMMVII